MIDLSKLKQAAEVDTKAQHGWEIIPTSDGMHIMPLGDLKPHSMEKCSCLPYEDGTLFLHNSFDGREAFERMERKPS